MSHYVKTNLGRVLPDAVPRPLKFMSMTRFWDVRPYGGPRPSGGSLFFGGWGWGFVFFLLGCAVAMVPAVADAWPPLGTCVDLSFFPRAAPPRSVGSVPEVDSKADFLHQTSLPAQKK